VVPARHEFVRVPHAALQDRQRDSGQLGPTLGIASPPYPEFYSDLACGGLESSTVYQGYSAAVQQQITATITAEQNGVPMAQNLLVARMTLAAYLVLGSACSHSRAVSDTPDVVSSVERARQARPQATGVIVGRSLIQWNGELNPAIAAYFVWQNEERIYGTRLPDESFIFTLEPGKYRVEGSAIGWGGKITRPLGLNAGDSLVVTFTHKRPLPF
jgi:hypothetical protein